MSHTHSHAPGEVHSHSHSHEQPQSPQSPVMPTPDPGMQALIDQQFKPIPLTLSEDKNSAYCEKHHLEKCVNCEVDFVGLNRLSALLAMNPSLLCPPPANIVTQKVTQIVTATKDEGNTLFKSQRHSAAVTRYTAAAGIAVSRPPWETNQLMREELSTVISNRSAAYFEAHDYISALADAEAVIAIRRQWSKGHFRKAKALLGLNRLREAANAIRLGLSFEPTNNELITFLVEIEKYETKTEHAKAQSRAEKSQQSTVVA